MSLTELLPSIEALPRGEKLRLIQILAGQLAVEEDIIPDKTGKPVSEWSPYNALEGAAALLRVLEEKKDVR